MFSLRSVVLCLLVLAAARSPLWSQSRIFLMPSGGSTVVSVLDAANLGLVGTIPGNINVSEVLGTPQGDRYYLLSNSAADALVTVDAGTLEVVRRRPLDAGVAHAVVTPDGERLLVAAGDFYVFETRLDEELIAQIDVGGRPAKIEVNGSGTRAYVLAASRLIVEVDLESLEIVATIDVPVTRDILLTEAEDRLLAVLRTGLRQLRTSDNSEIGTIETNWEMGPTAEILPIGASTKVFVRNRASPPNNTSQIFDYVAETVRAVGTIGSTELRSVTVIDEELAFGILSPEDQAVEIDLTTTPTASVGPLDVDFSVRTLSASPNGKQLFLSSPADSSVTIYDVEARQITNTTQVATAPSRHSVVFAPSLKPPASISINSGDNQFVRSGASTPAALSVKVRDEDGRPLFNVPVEFTLGSEADVEFVPAALTTTDSRGVAGVVVNVPASLPLQQPALGKAFEAAQALEPPRATLDEGVESVIITANTAAGLSADFTLNIIRGTGLIKVSGDFQITEPESPFPLPFVVLATDEEGNPVPPGTAVIFAPSGIANCGQLIVLVDASGSATNTCEALPLSAGAGSSRDGSVTVSVPGRADLGVAVFRISVAIAARNLVLEKVSGDGQSAETGSLLLPLVFEVKSTSTLGTNGVGVTLRRIDGPAVSINPIFAVARLGFPVAVNVVLGPRAGTTKIEATANSPNAATTVFTIEATGGRLVRFEKEGDQQSGRIGRILPLPLRMRVFNETGQKVPFPEVAWTVRTGDATLLTASDPDGATARVQFGFTPGPVVVEGRIEELGASFNLTALPPVPASITRIEGEGQTLQVGETSEPLIVEVREIDTEPASGGLVEFQGPANVLFHPLVEGAGGPANPLVQQAALNGRTGAAVELLGIIHSEASEASAKTQQANAVAVTVTAGQVTTSFVIDVLGRTPELSAEGVVNAASFLSGIVPGSLASLFGVGLSEGIEGTEEAGGETSFKGTSVRIGGIAAPLLTITGGATEQINLQVPFELLAGQTATVEVENNGVSASVSGVPVFGTQPGILEKTIGEATTVAAVLKAANFELVTPENPAGRQESLALFFTGGGLLSPVLLTGTLGPVPPAEMALPVMMTVDNQPAEVSFQGYAPGLLGLYQVNFSLPDGVECGVRPLAVNVGGTLSPPSTIAVQCP